MACVCDTDSCPQPKDSSKDFTSDFKGQCFNVVPVERDLIKTVVFWQAFCSCVGFLHLVSDSVIKHLLKKGVALGDVRFITKKSFTGIKSFWIQ